MKTKLQELKYLSIIIINFTKNIFIENKEIYIKETSKKKISKKVYINRVS